jgi:hypothetical protein
MSGRTDESTPLLAVLVRSLAAVAGVAAANAGRRAAVAAAGYLIVAGLFVASLCFLTAAGHAAISLALGGVYSSLIVGCVYLVAGLLAALVLAIRRR